MRLVSLGQQTTLRIPSAFFLGVCTYLLFMETFLYFFVSPAWLYQSRWEDNERHKTVHVPYKLGRAGCSAYMAHLCEESQIFLHL